ncbi:hypothetical protein [Streptomyces sp. NBC_01217]|uniref:hypothetical protein n=1 Tax=Streptomyces sp. NBC_01217 TaxID=2903779 RepID=UPI002E0D996C|nr:hypothetical protein OG507_29875 [Streptomyces sp. NBC_01217]
MTGERCVGQPWAECLAARPDRIIVLGVVSGPGNDPTRLEQWIEQRIEQALKGTTSRGRHR